MSATLPAAAVLGRLSEGVIAAVYGHERTSDALRAALFAEMDRRDKAAEREREAQRKAIGVRTARRAERAGKRAEWERMAHAQYLAAEAHCRGELLNAAGIAAQVDPAELWSGPAHRADLYASEELRNYWRDISPRIDIGTFFRQASGERRDWLDRRDREEARDDRMGEHARDAVRRAEGERPQGARVRGDGRGDHVPGSHAAGSVPQVREAAAGDRRPGGPVQRGRPDVKAACEHFGRAPDNRCEDCPLRVRGTVATGSTAQAQIAALRARAEEIRARTPLSATVPAPAVSGTLSPAPDRVRPAGADVAVREGTVVSAARPHIDGDMVARYIYTALKRFAVWNSEAEIITATAWIMQAHAKDPDTGQPAWQYSPRLFFAGPSGSGKSWKARLVCKLSPNGEILLEPTKPSFLDMCADNQTIAITEADELFYTAGRNRGILAAVNAGYEPDRNASRKHGGKTLKIPVYTPIVLDGLATMLEATRSDLRTMVSRCLVVICDKAPEGYRPPRFDRDARLRFEQLSQLAAAWAAQEIAGGMADTVPVVPEHLGNRPFALWEPLFTVMQHVDGGDPEGPWSTAIRESCEYLEASSGLPEPETGETELDRTMAEWGEEF